MSGPTKIWLDTPHGDIESDMSFRRWDGHNWHYYAVNGFMKADMTRRSWDISAKFYMGRSDSRRQYPLEETTHVLGRGVAGCHIDLETFWEDVVVVFDSRVDGDFTWREENGRRYKWGGTKHEICKHMVNGRIEWTHWIMPNTLTQLLKMDDMSYSILSYSNRKQKRKHKPVQKPQPRMERQRVVQIDRGPRSDNNPVDE